MVVQRVAFARVEVAGSVQGEIGPGFLVYLGVGQGDTEKEADVLCHKLLNLRIFEDEAGKMNISLLQSKREVLVVSQFTLYADTSRGFRPGFSDAMEPVEANRLYEYVLSKLAESGTKIQCGKFGADMKVSSLNDGPVTILLDTASQG
jgi:D-tyrosyl-tRNA(Tyr) deacylase